jgi:hypothetical protein
MNGWTDYPIIEFGDHYVRNRALGVFRFRLQSKKTLKCVFWLKYLTKPRKIRHVNIFSYDGNKYYNCRVKDGSKTIKTSIKTGYVYDRPAFSREGRVINPSKIKSEFSIFDKKSFRDISDFPWSSDNQKYHIRHTRQISKAFAWDKSSETWVKLAEFKVEKRKRKKRSLKKNNRDCQI